MPSLFLAAKQATYRAQRTASQGASITLVYGCGQFTASFDCVARITPILGTRGLGPEQIPNYAIPFEDAQSAITKLAEKHSVALVDSVCDADSGRFVLIWKIPQAAKVEVEGENELLHALKTMVVATDTSLPEQFPGHSEAYLNTVAIPRAKEAIAKAEGTERVVAFNPNLVAPYAPPISETTATTKQTFDPDEY